MSRLKACGAKRFKSIITLYYFRLVFANATQKANHYTCSDYNTLGKHYNIQCTKYDMVLSLIPRSIISYH